MIVHHPPKVSLRDDKLLSSGRSDLVATATLRPVKRVVGDGQQVVLVHTVVVQPDAEATGTRTRQAEVESGYRVTNALCEFAGSL